MFHKYKHNKFIYIKDLIVLNKCLIYSFDFKFLKVCFLFSGQLNTIRPSRPSVKFGPGPQQHVNSALHNTTTPNNYRRF
jgi:hypothetical protein